MGKWSFVYVADIQPGSPKSFRFNPQHRENWETARKQIMELSPSPDLLLIGGDLTRDGSIHKWELEIAKSEIDSMNIPYHVIPGNMDTGNKHTRIQGAYDTREDIKLNITPEQIRQFESVFGPTTWSFVHKGVRFSGFCDMIINSGLPEEKKFWEWTETLKKESSEKNHIWIMHYALFIDDVNEPNFDITDSDQYLDWYFSIDKPGRDRLMELFKATGTTRVITGHIHCKKDHHAEGIAFDLAPGVAMSQYSNRWPDADNSLGFYRYNVDGDTITREFIPLSHVSTAEGQYGPGGHPKPEERDYSLAWEK